MDKEQKEIIMQNLEQLTRSMVERSCLEIATQDKLVIGVCNGILPIDGTGGDYQVFIGDAKLVLSLNVMLDLRKLVSAASTVFAGVYSRTW